MVDTFVVPGNYTVDGQARRARIAWLLMFLGLLGLSAQISLTLLRRGPDSAIIAWLIFFAGIIAIFYQPRYGVYLIVGLGLVSDYSLIPWYPFTKNLSSYESLLYLGRAFSGSPMEIYFVLTFVAWLGGGAVRRKLRFYTGPLFWPTILFLVFVTYGLLNGMRSGDRMMALWEARAIYYIPMMLILGSNLIETRRHISHVLWIIIGALFIRSLFGVWYVITVLEFKFAGVERIAEHAMSILFNSVIVMAIGAWMFRDTRGRRLVLLLVLPTMLLSHVANNRRSSYIALAIALMLIAVLLYRVNRRVFYYIVPLAAVIGLAYIVVFWRASGPLAAPAKAVRSVIGEPDPRDYSSNLYRQMENINIMFTIRTASLRGIGFGNRFYRISAMYELEFAFSDYLTHNSILWVWMKTGLGGFMSMLFMIGMTLVVGGRILWRAPGGVLSVAALTATLTIIMHFVFAYVDMSWFAAPLMYIGLLMAIINSLEAIAGRPVAQPEKRWPWQPDAPPVPGLLPLPAPRAQGIGWW